MLTDDDTSALQRTVNDSIGSLKTAAAPSSSIRSRMTWGVAWMTVGMASNQGSTLVVNIILARLLEQQAFGRYAILASTLAIAASLAQVATGYTATKYLAETRDHDKPRAGRILGMCTAVSLVMGALAAFVLFTAAHRLAEFLADPDLMQSVRIVGGVVFFNAINGFLSGALAGFENYPALGKVGVVSGLSYVLLCTAGGAVKGIDGALVGALMSGAVQAILLAKLLRDSLRRWQIVVDLSSFLDERQAFSRFYVPAALTGVVTLPAIWISNALLARQVQGYEQLALFSAANSFRIMVLFLPNVLNAVGMSVLNNQRGAGQEASFRRLFWQNLATSGIIGLVGVLVVVVTGRWLIAAFGPNFSAAYGILLLLMVAALAESLAMAAFQVIQAHGQIWSSLLGIALPSYLTLVALTFLLTPTQGAFGLAWAYVGCWMLALSLNTFFAWRIGVWRNPSHSLA
jgi:O-antigen/teichoic acid export membrane protein